MTPAELETLARQMFNSVGDTFYSQSEIMSYITDACYQLSQEGLVIQATDSSTTSVDGTRAYAIPSDCNVIKRVEYDGQKLQPISFREDDTITVTNTTTDDSGTPAYYTLWDDEVLLRPVPDTTGDTIKFYYLKIPTTTTIAGSIDAPSIYHYQIANYVVYRMAMKDSDDRTAQMYLNLWQDALRKAMINERKKLRYDAYKGAMDEDMMQATVIGMI